MDVAELKVDREKAREFYKLYQEHRQFQTPEDREIAKIYRLIAQGRVVIQALESIRRAGFNAQGYPKLAICRADARTCYYGGRTAGATFSIDRSSRAYESRRTVSLRWGDTPLPTLERGSYWLNGEAAVPLIPVHLRPKQALSNYYILWEAEWRRVAPVDPMLLVRMGADTWLVVAAWELTEIERAAMTNRLNA